MEPLLQIFQQQLGSTPDSTAESVVAAQFAAEVDRIKGRLAAAPPNEAWRVALDIVDKERVSRITCFDTSYAADPVH